MHCFLMFRAWFFSFKGHCFEWKWPEYTLPPRRLLAVTSASVGSYCAIRFIMSLKGAAVLAHEKICVSCYMYTWEKWLTKQLGLKHSFMHSYAYLIFLQIQSWKPKPTLELRPDRCQLISICKDCKCDDISSKAIIQAEMDLELLEKELSKMKISDGSQ